MNSLKNLDQEQASQILTENTIEEIAEGLKKLNLQRLCMAIDTFNAVDAEQGKELFAQITPEVFSEKIEQSNYATRLIFIAGLTGLHDNHLRYLLREMPQDLLFREEQLKNIYHFNKLLYIYFRLEMESDARKVLRLLRRNLPGFMKSSDIRTLVSFFQLVSNYRNIRPYLDRYGKGLFNKIRFYLPRSNRDKQFNPIPSLLRVVAEHHHELGKQMLLFIDNMVSGRKEKWGNEVDAREILGYCYYQIARFYTERKTYPNRTLSNISLGTAIRFFEKTETKSGLCLSYLLKSKNAQYIDDLESARDYATKAAMYAGEAGLDNRAEEINTLLKELS